MWNNKYPFTSFNEYNLDWIIKKIKEFEVSLTDFEALHSITFGGDWDISKQYEQWTIVSDPNSHDGYLSLKPVPNNVQITNSEYWLKIADYTTGLASVNARVDDLENDIETNLEPRLEDAEDAITLLDGEVSYIKNTTIPNIQSDITDLQNNLTASKNRKILIFGDSYFEPNPPYGGTDFETYLTECLQNVPNVEFELKSDGGEGFGQTGTYSFTYDVQNYVPTFNPDEITDIFFIGGYNDRTHTASEIYDGMRNSFTLCKTKYPNAKISCGHFGWSGTLASTDRDKILDYSLPAWRYSKWLGAGYMKNAEYTLHDYDLFYDNDRFHPNGNGTLELAIQITNYILTGSCDVHYRYKALKFNQGDITGAYTQTQYTVAYQLDNERITIYLPDANIVYDSDFDISSNENYIDNMLQIASMTIGHKGYCLGTRDGAPQLRNVIPINGYIQTTGATFKTLAECQFNVKGGFLSMRAYGINSGRTGFDTYTGVHAIHPIGGAITIPTLSC